MIPILSKNEYFRPNLLTYLWINILFTHVASILTLEDTNYRFKWINLLFYQNKILRTFSSLEICSILNIIILPFFSQRN